METRKKDILRLSIEYNVAGEPVFSLVSREALYSFKASEYQELEVEIPISHYKHSIYRPPSSSSDPSSDATWLISYWILQEVLTDTCP